MNRNLEYSLCMARMFSAVEQIFPACHVSRVGRGGEWEECQSRDLRSCIHPFVTLFMRGLRFRIFAARISTKLNKDNKARPHTFFLRSCLRQNNARKTSGTQGIHSFIFSICQWVGQLVSRQLEVSE